MAFRVDVGQAFQDAAKVGVFSDLIRQGVHDFFPLGRELGESIFWRCLTELLSVALD